MQRVAGACLVLAMLAAACAAPGHARSTEHVEVQPLPEEHLLTQLTFTLTQQDMPRELVQPLRQLHVQQLDVSLTQGRWHYDTWPLRATAAPVGAQVLAVFPASLPDPAGAWRRLTHTLSGVLCASLQFMDETQTVEPVPGLFSTPISNHTRLRYASLPREPVCTENLAPWSRHLPCRLRAGVARLLAETPHVHAASYVSLGVEYRAGSSSSSSTSDDEGEGDGGGDGEHIVLTAVTVHSIRGLPRPLVLARDVFGHASGGVSACVHVDHSRILLSAGPPGPGVLVFPPRDPVGMDTALVTDATQARKVILEDPDQRRTLHTARAGDEGRLPHADLLLLGYGHGGAAIKLVVHPGTGVAQRVHWLQVVPWYVRVLLHTAQAHVDGDAVPLSNVLNLVHVAPAQDRLAPMLLQAEILVPAGARAVSVSMRVDKAFLHLTEHPPDANRGFDLPAGLLRFPEASEVVATKALLSAPPLPDFSMPYNVITLTCTVFALSLGSMLNIVMRRWSRDAFLPTATAASSSS